MRSTDLDLQLLTERQVVLPGRLYALLKPIRRADAFARVVLKDVVFQVEHLARLKPAIDLLGLLVHAIETNVINVGTSGLQYVVKQRGADSFKILPSYARNSGV